MHTALLGLCYLEYFNLRGDICDIFFLFRVLQLNAVIFIDGKHNPVSLDVTDRAIVLLHEVLLYVFKQVLERCLKHN